jgi:putative peptidoglycan lipid II flippase
MTEKDRVTRAAGIVGTATLLSRIFGFVRDVVIAWFFGAGLSADAFFVAFRIPNLLRRLFAEGSLTVAFIPVFTGYLKNQGEDEAFGLARSAVRFLFVLLIVVTAIGILLSPWIVRIIAPGFWGSPPKFTLTVSLTRIMFPYIFFIGLVALCMGILNTLGHFAAPALAPVFLNIAMIGSVFFISPRMIHPIKGLALGVIIGGTLQLILQIPFLLKKGFHFWKNAELYHPGLKRIGALMLPTIFGAAVYQVNILVGTLLASLLPEGSVSYLYYADRLVQFPLGIFAVATATAVLPSLSRQAVDKDFQAVNNTFTHALNLVFFITIPAMVGLIVLREPIVALLFKRGAFDAEASRLTAYALLYYALGLWAFSAVRIVVSTFYALQDTKTPVKMAVISILANIILSIILMRFLLHGGLALATSLASILNLGLLVSALKHRIGRLNLKSIIASLSKSTMAAIIMGACVWAISLQVIPDYTQTTKALFIGLTGCIVVGLILYGALSLLLKSPEVRQLTAIVRESIEKN